MFYQVRANLYFTIADEAADFYHDCELALAKASVVNPGQLNMEFSSIDIVENHHDEEPNNPCFFMEKKDNCPVSPD